MENENEAQAQAQDSAKSKICNIGDGGYFLCTGVHSGTK